MAEVVAAHGELAPLGVELARRVHAPRVAHQRIDATAAARVGTWGGESNGGGGLFGVQGKVATAHK